MDHFSRSDPIDRRTESFGSRTTLVPMDHRFRVCHPSYRLIKIISYLEQWLRIEIRSKSSVNEKFTKLEEIFENKQI